MVEMVTIYVMGQPHRVPKSLTIMQAMEYIGYRFIRGAGCRGGFCGACATVYRTKGDYKLKVALACQKVVEDGMNVAIIPFVPAKRVSHDLEAVRPRSSILLEFYPEVAKCLSCGTCSKSCPQDIEVMDYVQAAVRGEIDKVAELSFDCIQCGLCAVRCPMGIVPYHMAQMARRIYGKYMLLRAKHLEERVREISEGKFEKDLNRLLSMSKEELEVLYEGKEASD